jgi:hypothetical protein
MAFFGGYWRELFYQNQIHSTRTQFIGRAVARRLPDNKLGMPLVRARLPPLLPLAFGSSLSIDDESRATVPTRSRQTLTALAS